MHTGAALKGPLDPTERISEALFGLIMVLTFTCSISAAEAGHEGVRTMLYGAVGCHLAWAVIGAAYYLLDRISARGQTIRTLRALREAQTPAAGQRMFAD